MDSVIQPLNNWGPGVYLKNNFVSSLEHTIPVMHISDYVTQSNIPSDVTCKMLFTIKVMESFMLKYLLVKEAVEQPSQNVFE